MAAAVLTPGEFTLAAVILGCAITAAGGVLAWGVRMILASVKESREAFTLRANTLDERLDVLDAHMTTAQAVAPELDRRVTRVETLVTDIGDQVEEDRTRLAVLIDWRHGHETWHERERGVRGPGWPATSN